MKTTACKFLYKRLVSGGSIVLGGKRYDSYELEQYNGNMIRCTDPNENDEVLAQTLNGELMVPLMEVANG